MTKISTHIREGYYNLTFENPGDVIIKERQNCRRRWSIKFLHPKLRPRQPPRIARRHFPRWSPRTREKMELPRPPRPWGVPGVPPPAPGPGAGSGVTTGGRGSTGGRATRTGAGAGGAAAAAMAGRG